MRTGGVVTGPTSLNISHEKERLKKKKKEGERWKSDRKVRERWVARMSGLSEWMTDRQQPDRKLTARRRADSLPLCRAFATSNITSYRTYVLILVPFIDENADEPPIFFYPGCRDRWSFSGKQSFLHYPPVRISLILRVTNLSVFTFANFHSTSRLTLFK